MENPTPTNPKPRAVDPSTGVSAPRVAIIKRAELAPGWPIFTAIDEATGNDLGDRHSFGEAAAWARKLGYEPRAHQPANIEPKPNP